MMACLFACSLVDIGGTSTSSTTGDGRGYEITAFISCKDITAPGMYVLNSNVINNSALVCINISSSDVVLEGNGYIVDGVDGDNTTGVYVYNPTSTLTNVTVKNLVVSDWENGIYYRNTADGGVANNTAYSNTDVGVYLIYSNNTLLRNNTVEYNSYGIALLYSHNNTVLSSNSTFNAGAGLRVVSSSNNTLVNNTLNDNGYGVALTSSSNNALSNNTVNSNSYGIQMDSLSNYNILQYGAVSFNTQFGVGVFDSWGNTLSSNTILGNRDGVQLHDSENNTLANNNIGSNSFYGIYLYYSIDNNITGNNVTYGEFGINLLSGSSNNSISWNTINGSDVGIGIRSSSTNFITGNTVSSSVYYGIRIKEQSYGNNIVNNNASLNQGNGLYFSDSSPTNNTIYSNTFCSNNISAGGYYDINDLGDNSGDYNICDTTYNYNDTGIVGCTYFCNGSLNVNWLSYNTSMNFTVGVPKTINATELNISLLIVTNINVSNSSVYVILYPQNPTNTSTNFTGLSKFLEFSLDPILENALNSSLITLHYTGEDLNSNRVGESTLVFYWLNETVEEWQRLNASSMGWVHDTGVDTTNNYVWANVTHFSTYTIGGESLTSTHNISLQQGWNLISLPLNT